MMHKLYERILEHLPDNAVEAWTFDTAQSRRATEQLWLAKGKLIKLHSAYKTLLCSVLEQGILDNVTEITIRYPVVPEDEPKRFLLECYPLSDLVAVAIHFEAFDCDLDAHQLPYYELLVDGVAHRIPVPVRWVTRSTGVRQLAACGWVKDKDGNAAHLNTEFEQIFEDACAYVADLPLVGKSPPFFDRLQFDIGLPMRDTALTVGDEHLSLIEAMHEDVYFSALEIFQQRLGLGDGDRGVCPGQIFPKVFYAEQASLAIHEIRVDAAHDVDGFGCPDLRKLGHWLSPKQIGAKLNALSGESFSVTSRQGRSVHGRLLGEQDAPVKLAISGGQHANESSGVVGALRAAEVLQQDKAVAFTLCPSENVDGYAGFRELCHDNPKHMHHAARYTAAGNDLTHSDTFESTIRALAQTKLAADVHVNLHGYPAHEWTRPLSGYIPKGFADWTIPKGFFLIARYHRGYEALAKRCLDAAIAAIAEHPEQMRVNAAMIQRYLHLIPNPDFDIAHDCIPTMVARRDDGRYPVEIITEAPDETIYGEDFRIAHESQFRVIMAIVDTLKNH